MSWLMDCLLVEWSEEIDLEGFCLVKLSEQRKSSPSRKVKEYDPHTLSYVPKCLFSLD